MSDANKHGPKPKTAQRKMTPISLSPKNDLATLAPIVTSESDDVLAISMMSSSAPDPSSKVTWFIPKILRKFFGLTGAGARAQVQAQVPAPPNLDVNANVQDDLAPSSPPATEDATHLRADAVNGVKIGGGLSILDVGPAFVIAVAASAERGSMVQVGTKRKRD